MNVSPEDYTIVSIVGFKHPDDVVCCLKAVSGLTNPRFAVSICENGGPNAFRSLLERLHDVVSPVEPEFDSLDDRIERIWSGVLGASGQPVHVLQAKSNLGFAGGVNATLKQFERDQRWTAVWLLNPDAEPEPDALSALARRARETGAFIVGGRLVFRDSGQIQLYGGRWRPWLARGYNIGLNSPKDAPVDIQQIEDEMNYVGGASMYVTRAFVDKVGLMDEDYFLYCEEVDWCLRVDPKYIRYAHDCVVYHRHGTAIGSSPVASKRSDLSVYLTERNKLLLSRRFYPRIYPAIVVIAFLLLLQYVAKGASNKASIGLRGWWAGLGGETGLPHSLVESS